MARPKSNIAQIIIAFCTTITLLCTIANFLQKEPVSISSSKTENIDSSETTKSGTAIPPNNNRDMIKFCGRILDKATKQPISNANIEITGLNKETNTDSIGNFKLFFKAPRDTLIHYTVVADNYKAKTSECRPNIFYKGYPINYTCEQVIFLVKIE